MVGVPAEGRGRRDASLGPLIRRLAFVSWASGPRCSNIGPPTCACLDVRDTGVYNLQVMTYDDLIQTLLAPTCVGLILLLAHEQLANKKNPKSLQILKHCQRSLKTGH